MAPQFILPTDSVYIIAEAGINHDGKPEKARQLVEIAADSGADAVKFQLFDLDEIVSEQTPLAEYQKRSGEVSQYQMLKRIALPLEEYRYLKKYAEELDLDFIVTPFDAGSARFLAGLGVKAIKIPSGEITNMPFLRQVAALNVFTIISTGMSNLDEVKEAVVPFEEAKTSYALLHCVSSYPAPVNQINLRAMRTLEEAFNVPVGYSDHTESIWVSVTAAAIGARIIEKHFTVSKKDPGPDHAASLEPDELKEMVRIIKNRDALRHAVIIRESLGTGEKVCQPCEVNTRDVARRSFVLARDAKAGEKITEDLLAIKRPGAGIAPKELGNILGKTLTRTLPAGAVLTWACVR